MTEARVDTMRGAAPPRTLGPLLAGLTRVETPARPIAGVALDTRALEAGYLYLALGGATAHGLDYLEQALAKGASAIAVDLADDVAGRHLDSLERAAVALVRIADLKRRAGEIAARFHGEPSRSLTVVAVTGTDGKTSVCRFLQQAFTSLRGRAGYIGTLGWGAGDALRPTALTTPDAVSLQAMLAALRDEGVDIVALEASSHGIAEGRLSAVEIDVAVLTNFGRDHLDYHGDLAGYRAAKAALFDLSSLRAVVVNGDDALGQALDRRHAARTSLRRVRFHGTGMPESAAAAAGIMVAAESVVASGDGLAFTIVEFVDGLRTDAPVSLPLIGHFNVDNVLACHGVMRALDVSANDAIAALGTVRAVPGRMERFVAPDGAVGRPLVVVDYAHTPQALASAIRAARAHLSGDLWIVFGCGGDRDPGKRAPMGRAAEAADHVVLTDDNPRSEDPASIRRAVRGGMQVPEAVIEIGDRREAIAYAVERAAESDVILIAGKGHEDYQIVGGERLAFSDRDWATRLLAGAAG